MEVFDFKRISPGCGEVPSRCVCIHVPLFFWSVFCCFLVRGAGWQEGLKEQAHWSPCSQPCILLALSLPHILPQTLVIISLQEWGNVRRWERGWWFAQRTVQNPPWVWREVELNSCCLSAVWVLKGYTGSKSGRIFSSIYCVWILYIYTKYFSSGY